MDAKEPTWRGCLGKQKIPGHCRWPESEESVGGGVTDGLQTLAGGSDQIIPRGPSGFQIL